MEHATISEVFQLEDDGRGKKSEQEGSVGKLFAKLEARQRSSLPLM